MVTWIPEHHRAIFRTVSVEEQFVMLHENYHQFHRGTPFYDAFHDTKLHPGDTTRTYAYIRDVMKYLPPAQRSKYLFSTPEIKDYIEEKYAFWFPLDHALRIKYLGPCSTHYMDPKMVRDVLLLSFIVLLYFFLTPALL